MALTTEGQELLYLLQGADGEVARSTVETIYKGMAPGLISFHASEDYIREEGGRIFFRVRGQSWVSYNLFDHNEIQFLFYLYGAGAGKNRDDFKELFDGAGVGYSKRWEKAGLVEIRPDQFTLITPAGIDHIEHMYMI